MTLVTANTNTNTRAYFGSLKSSVLSAYSCMALLEFTVYNTQTHLIFCDENTMNSCQRLYDYLITQDVTYVAHAHALTKYNTAASQLTTEHSSNGRFVQSIYKSISDAGSRSSTQHGLEKPFQTSAFLNSHSVLLLDLRIFFSLGRRGCKKCRQI